MQAPSSVRKIENNVFLSLLYLAPLVAESGNLLVARPSTRSSPRLVAIGHAGVTPSSG